MVMVSVIMMLTYEKPGKGLDKNSAPSLELFCKSKIIPKYKVYLSSCFFKVLASRNGYTGCGSWVLGGTGLSRRVAPEPGQSREVTGGVAGVRMSMGSGWGMSWPIGGG